MAKKPCKHSTTTYAKLKDGTVLVACTRCSRRIETMRGVKVPKDA